MKQREYLNRYNIPVLPVADRLIYSYDYDDKDTFDSVKHNTDVAIELYEGGTYVIKR